MRHIFLAGIIVETECIFVVYMWYVFVFHKHNGNIFMYYFFIIDKGSPVWCGKFVKPLVLNISILKLINEYQSSLLEGCEFFFL